MSSPSTVRLELDVPRPSTPAQPDQLDVAARRRPPLRQRGVVRFVGHYLEMVVAMLAGMAALAASSALIVDLPDQAVIELIEMAVWMTVPMVAWMRRRGHRWRVCHEMAAAMLVPAAVALALLGTGLVTSSHALLMGEHIAMFPAMLLAMVLRSDEYTHHNH